MKSKLFLFSLIFPVIISAQTELTQDQVKEDYGIFKTIITTAHPSLYDYTTKSQWDSIFIEFEENLKQTKTSGELFKSISALSNNVKDGHLIVYHPKMDTVPPMFPLLLKII